MTKKFESLFLLFIYIIITMIGPVRGTTTISTAESDDIIRADLPVTKTDRRISNIYCIANPKAREFKAHERLLDMVDADAFMNCSELINITLSSTRLNNLFKDTFKYNFKLEWLDLANNRLDYIHRDTFATLKDLQILELWDNFLHSLHKDTFKYNLNLRKLVLYGNQLEFIHQDTFMNLVNLKVLHLDNNKLKTLQPELVRNLAKLRVFFFYSNELPRIDQEQILQNLPSLNETNFNNNDFSCGEVKRIVDVLSERPDITIEVEVWSNPRRPDANETVNETLYCIPDTVWLKNRDDYRQRAVRAEILYDLQMSLDEQRDAIDELRSTVYMLQLQMVRQTAQLKSGLAKANKEVDDLKLQVSQLKLTNLELLNSKLKLEEEYRRIKADIPDATMQMSAFNGTVNLHCKVDAYPATLRHGTA